MSDPFAGPDPVRHLAALPADLAGRSVAEMNRPDLARYQHHMAMIGQAIGQCPACWAYRADGLAPDLHRPGAACCDQDGRPL